ncbi:Protein detoxification 56 [Vitis vinifera]|uniref:Protein DETOXIFICATION n=1 Tax=Vitis vinifera TaxID=29760 RepID=A0A438K290_VITVI|nr:Protein detoxification 56 [Vitis vinifera]
MEKLPHLPSPPPPTHTMLSELRKQRGIVVPLMVMNLAWLGKCVITTVFLGQLGELQLAGGVLGFTFANVTGYSVLNGLCCAMEPICGQACGAKNVRLLHKTLVMVTILLLTTAVPISFLWLNVDKILIYFGQQEDISMVAKTYLLYLLPDLFVISLLCPLKTYLSAQSMVFPIMFSTSVALAFHAPINILLSRAKGLKGVSMAGWMEGRRVWDQGVGDWIKMLKLCGPSCLTTCLEWWCYEILVLLTGRLPNAKQAVGELAIVLNFDYLLYSVMQSLATCASTRVSNELGANQPDLAYQSAYISFLVSFASGCIGAAMMVSARGIWGYLYSHDARTIRGVKKMLLLMAPVEVVNFPLAVCGGIVRGTARMSLAMYANLGGFYLVALPLGMVFAFKAGLGLGGLLIGLLVGVVVCLALLLVFIFRIDWAEAAGKAQILACREQEIAKEDENHRILKTLENP